VEPEGLVGRREEVPSHWGGFWEGLHPSPVVLPRKGIFHLKWGCFGAF